MIHPKLCANLLVFSIVPVLCLPVNHTDSLVNAEIDAGTFLNPSVNVRPRFRYWLPDASVDHAQAVQDVAAAKAVGAGGVEVLGYYLYDAAPNNYAPTNWEIYGWGTPAWSEWFDDTCQAFILIHYTQSSCLTSLLRHTWIMA